MRYASVCDGIGAVHVAWKPLGWRCVWTSEIEPFPAAVVDHHHGLTNLGDMTLITEEMLHGVAPGPIDVLVGGTPCQSFSVAGLRRGLDDPRGNLALRFVQLVGVLRPTWVVWENVPGVLSSGGGRDFGTFLGALADLGYGFAYRVLDAQWFGVAQRRRRVFLVGHARDWRRAAAVLFERESVRGNPPTRAKAWQDAAGATAPCTPGGRGSDSDDRRMTAPAVANPLTARMSKGLTTTCDEGQTPVVVSDDPTHAICANEQRTYTNEGKVFQLRNVVAQPFVTAKRAQSATDDETWVPGEVAPTQNTFDTGETRATTVVATDFQPTTLKIRGRDGVRNLEYRSDGTANCLRSANGGRDGMGIGAMQHGMAVRRLTPLECERLQGFPDGYTAIQFKGKPAADGPRYRALGNSMAVPCMRWIGERIALLERIAPEDQRR